uniref:Cyclic nucleotide-binding protein n=1 Tax=Cyanothece sp. (strain PCC 7425 / ATCC 29141) TaxID=395961 RepID=B8HN66_CYAP4
MQTEDFSQLFPLFNAGSPDVLESVLSVAWENSYPAGRAVLIEDAWGNAVYFILEGWVKVRLLPPSGEDTALAVLGPGDFFGEMAILDESPRSTDVVALSEVKVLGVPAQKFTQMLFREPQVNYRLLQLMARRLRQSNARFERQQQPPVVKLANTLATLGQNYGPHYTDLKNNPGGGMAIFNIPAKDLADISDISVEDTTKLIAMLSSKGWIKVDAAQQKIYLLDLPQLLQLVLQQTY